MGNSQKELGEGRNASSDPASMGRVPSIPNIPKIPRVPSILRVLRFPRHLSIPSVPTEGTSPGESRERGAKHHC